MKLGFIAHCGKMEALRAYVQGGSSSSLLDSSTVRVDVSHSNLKHHFNELRADLHTSIGALKQKLGRQCGTSPDYMMLQLYDVDNLKVCDMNDASRPFGFYSPQDGYRIHIVDLDPTSVTGWLEDLSQVEKFTISEDAYNKRDDTFRKFKEKRVGDDPAWAAAANKVPDENFMADLAAGMKVGDRCEVDVGQKRGVVRFVGKADGLPSGFWVGIEYDEPVGKHDGSIKGKQYFNCPAGHGAMVRPDKVKVGDFPELDPFEDELDEI